MKKAFAFTLGLIFLILALIGIPLPVLPTTPFALLAIFFFSKSSRRFVRICLSLPLIGEGIRDWQKQRRIRPRAKVMACGLMSFSIIFIYINPNIFPFVKHLVSLSIFVVMVFILKQRS